MNINVEFEEKKYKLEELEDKLKIVKDKCAHNIIIKLKDYDYKNQCNEAYCLCCNNRIYSRDNLFNYKFKYIIYAKDLPLSDIDENELLTITKRCYNEIINEDDKLSDKEIVHTIRKRLNEYYITKKE